MVERFNIRELVRTRADQRSFHIASEKNVRVEFRNMVAGDRVDPFSYDGDLVLTCYKGAFVLKELSGAVNLVEMDLAVIPASSSVSLECTIDGTIQIIWAPAFAATAKG
jgi:hypothetical protein